MDQTTFPTSSLSSSATVVYSVLALYAAHQLLVYFDYAVLSPQEILWNLLIFLTPACLLLDATQRKELGGKDMWAQRNAAKSEALRKMLGFSGSGALQSALSSVTDAASSTGGIMRRASMLTNARRPPISEAPSGLGNWDNSCYQNSVLQALASVQSLPTWLDAFRTGESDAQSSTSLALGETISQLRDQENNGRHIWTPAKLKNMSSWQQQDAQEYFSKVLDELDKEAKKKAKAQAKKLGLETIVEGTNNERRIDNQLSRLADNPLEGLTAQRISCTECGYSEGYSMTPFNCLTVPLGPAFTYQLSDCLDEYTKREEIEGVECRKCTLLRAKQRLKQLVRSAEGHARKVSDGIPENRMLSLPPEVREQILERLRAMENALELDDFADKTMKETCQIQPKAFVMSTKVREALVGRAPQTLVIHINRSVFDEMTGAQRKNYAQVQYPLLLDINPWTLDLGGRTPFYRLRAAVTHYGRHENGHYICYRQHPSFYDAGKEKQSEKWWRLSDEDVSPISEDDVLHQSGAFMLLYEREELSESARLLKEAIEVPLPVDDPLDFEEPIEIEAPIEEPRSTALLVPPSPSVVAESDISIDEEIIRPVNPVSQPLLQTPLLRTAGPQIPKHEFETSRHLMSV